MSRSTLDPNTLALIAAKWAGTRDGTNRQEPDVGQLARPEEQQEYLAAHAEARLMRERL